MANRCLSDLADYVRKNGKQTCRNLADILGTSKSSVHRRQQKEEKRSHTPAASFFESEEGRRFILRVVIAAIFVFGITVGVGAKRISLFFTLINISQFAAVSTSRIFKIENDIEELIIKFKDKADSNVKSKASDLDITVGADETFFDHLMLLVLMDLNSGFIFVEKSADKRDHATWENYSLSWMSEFKKIRCFVSDKAKALLKLAKDSLGVDRMPDLFHMMNDVTTVMKFSFARLKKSNEKSIAEINKQIDKDEDNLKNKDTLINIQAKQKTLSVDQSNYQRNQRKLSAALHPFRILSTHSQTSSDVRQKMESSLAKIRIIQKRHEISDAKKKLDRVERQIPDAAKQIDLWWGWVNTSLDSEDITPELKDWLLHYLLPFIYWRSQLRKTRSKKIKRYYQISIRNAEVKLNAHPMTATLMPKDRQKESAWVNWAQQMTNIFLRTTSAVEGRNGWLSQVHFNGRGLPEKRIESQTAIHNYFLKRDDNTTACERLTGEKPEDLFEYILKNIGPLKEPRKYKTQNNAKALILQTVPA